MNIGLIANRLVADLERERTMAEGMIEGIRLLLEALHKESKLEKSMSNMESTSVSQTVDSPDSPDVGY